MWILYATMAALSQSITRISNQQLKLDGFTLASATKLFQALITLPFLFITHWPDSPLFYVLVIATVPLVLYKDKSLFDFTAKYGAGAVTRIEPLGVPFTFVLWLIFNPDLFLKHLDNPLPFVGICLCIVTATLFAMRMRQCKISKDTLKAMLLPVVVAGTIPLLAKTCIDIAQGLSGIAVYIFIQASLIVLLSHGWNRANGKGVLKKISGKKIIFSALAVSALTLAVMALRLIAYQEVINPAYVNAVLLTAPFWTILINKIIRHKDSGDMFNGIGIVLSAIALVLFVSL